MSEHNFRDEARFVRVGWKFFATTAVLLAAKLAYLVFSFATLPDWATFVAVGAAAAPFFFAEKLALRLAKTGTLRRAADSDEAAFWSFRFFGRIFLATSFCVGIFGVSSVFAASAKLALTLCVVAVFASAWSAATLEFLAFEFAENRTNVFRAFAKIWRPAFSFAARRVSPYFLAAFCAFVLCVRNPSWPSRAAFGVVASVGSVYVFLASGPIRYLAATRRRLFCEKTPDFSDAEKRND